MPPTQLNSTTIWRTRFFNTSNNSRQVLASKKWNTLIIGGGHNGVTITTYLAKSGLSVAILERCHIIGSVAVTEEIIPGFKFSHCSYLQSLLRPAVIKELELKRHGLKLLKKNPSSFTPCLDGRYLLLGPDVELNHSQISKFSKRDVEAYQRGRLGCAGWHEKKALMLSCSTQLVNRNYREGKCGEMWENSSSSRKSMTGATVKKQTCGHHILPALSYATASLIQNQMQVSCMVDQRAG